MFFAVNSRDKQTKCENRALECILPILRIFIFVVYRTLTAIIPNTKARLMHREKKDKNFIHKPVYPGGRQAMRKFVAENLVYPEAAAAAAIRGVVTIGYTIDHQGKVVHTKVISRLGYGCDEEAVRVVSLLQFRVPRQRVRRVQFHKTINIHFRPLAPKKAPKPASGTEVAVNRQVQYHLTPAPKENREEAKKRDGGYTYTVRF